MSTWLDRVCQLKRPQKDFKSLFNDVIIFSSMHSPSTANDMLWLHRTCSIIENDWNSSNKQKYIFQPVHRPFIAFFFSLRFTRINTLIVGKKIGYARGFGEWLGLPQCRVH